MHRRQVGLIPWSARRKKRAALFALCSFLAFYHQLLHPLSTPSKFIAGMNDENNVLLPVESHPVFVESVPCTKSDDLPTEKWCFDRNNDPHYLWNSASEDIAVDSSQRLNTTFTSNETVTIKEFTHAGFEKCLANKTIIFVGDSRVRYQFLHLASYLKRAQFMKCDDDHNKASAEPADEECLLLDYRKSSSWSAWYNESTRMISDTNNININGNHTQTGTMKYQQQYALCDCARPDKRGIQNHYFENRYVQRKGAFGTIQLVSWFNIVNLVQIEEGFPPYSDFFSPKCCEVGGKCGRWIDAADPPCTNAFSGDTNKTLWEVIPKFYQNVHVFVNLGWEKHYNMKKQSEFTCSLQAFEQKYYPHIKPYLISHPPEFVNVKNPSRLFDASKLECNVDVFDRTTINTNARSDWYIDDVHVSSILNREYNQQLMRTLCPEMMLSV